MTNAHALAFFVIAAIIAIGTVMIIDTIHSEANRIISALRGEGAGPRRIDGRKPGVLIVDDVKVVDRH